MQELHLIYVCILLISSVSSYQLSKFRGSQSITTTSSSRYIGANSIYKRTILRTTTDSSDTDSGIKNDVIKLEQVIEMEPLSVPKKVEEWKDPVAVAAANKGPLDDLFPGG